MLHKDVDKLHLLTDLLHKPSPQNPVSKKIKYLPSQENILTKDK